MPMSLDGLAKMVEECGELAQVLGKKLAYPHTDDHPDGQGSLRDRLEAELADVLAISDFVVMSRHLDTDAIKLRAQAQLKRGFQQDGIKEFNSLLSSCFRLGRVASITINRLETHTLESALQKLMEGAIGDLLGSADHLVSVQQLNVERIEFRRRSKLNTFCRWHKDEKS